MTIDEQEQPLLSTRPAAIDDGSVHTTTAVAAGIRMLHALPQSLHNSQAQQQMRDVQHQRSNSSSGDARPALPSSRHDVQSVGSSSAETTAVAAAALQTTVVASSNSSVPPSASSIATDTTTTIDEEDDATMPPLEPAIDDAPTGRTDDQSAVDELQALVQRCHHALPFIALLLVYFAYDHTTGLVVFVVGSVALIGLDQRVRAQVARQDDASRVQLLGIVAMCLVDVVALGCIDRNAINLLGTPLERADDTTMRGFWDVVWTVVVHDFVIRFVSVALKAAVASVTATAWTSAIACTRPCATSDTIDHNSSSNSNNRFDVIDLEQQAPRASAAAAERRAKASTTFYRRKRKLFGIIELLSIFLRSLLASVPWCNYYQRCSSKFIADLFTCGYIFLKAVVLGAQGRRIVTLVRSFVTLELDFGVYVTQDVDDTVDGASVAAVDCSICYDVLQQPVKLACSHVFCEACVTEWLDREQSCPLCRTSIATAAHSSESGRRSTSERKPQYFDGSTSLFPQLF